MCLRDKSFQLAISLLIALSSTSACADIYGFVDRNGVHNYTDIPSDPRAKLLWRDPNGPKGIEIPTQPVLDYFIPAHLEREIDAAARAQTLDPNLLKAVIAIESRFNPRARSPKGAMGLMQLMPATARRYGVANAYDARQNLRGGARYLRDLLAMFNNDTRLALAAFNAGENAVIRYGRTIPPYPETRHYVPAVLAQMASLKKVATVALD